MGNNRNWKRKLQAILDEHNDAHGARNKSVSHSTASARAHALFRIFTLLRRLGFTPDPKNLDGTHIVRLVQYWTADPAISQRCQERGVPMLAQPYSAAYIQQQLSFLRVFSKWIGKPGMVLVPEHYVADPSLVSRTYTAIADKSWAGNSVNVEEAIAAVARIDEYVAAQLNLMLHFGLRRKEAVMFCPHAAIVPAHAIPANHPVSDQYVAFLRVKRGTKGGRLRFTAVRTDAQRRALDHTLRLAPYSTSHIGRPGLSLKQSLDRFDNVMRKAGISMKQLGVTPHGLRHQFAGDLFFDITELPAPARGGHLEADPDVIQAAYLEVARQLGHNRPQISNAYLGSPVNAKSTRISLVEDKHSA
ncbi:MAG TPA: integrase domain-containing protein [Noviherbaspirillum sp.]|nr:integrase domain-containing protein [Noviherbaspirillum sp.]